MTTATVETGPALLEVPLALLRESPHNYRELVDPAQDAELEASMAAQGQLAPLLARPIFQADGGISHYEIAAGASRRRCAERLGWPSLLTVVREMDDRTFLEALVTENLQRKDPHPLDEATAYARLEGLGYSHSEIAARVGMPARYIARRTRLTALIPEARKAFLQGKLFIGHAEALARCTPAQQEKGVKLATDWRGNPIPVRTLEEEIAREFHLPLGKAPFKTDDAELVPSAGACVSCPKRSGSMPDLFADIKGENVCTDGACYKSKVRALISRRIDEGRKAGTPLVRLSEQFVYNERPLKDGSPIPSNYWTVAKKSTPGAVEGVFVSGEKAGRTAWVTLSLPKPAKEGSKAKSPATKSDNHQAKRDHWAAVEQPAREHARGVLLAAVRAAAQAQGNDAVLRTVLCETLAHAWSKDGEQDFWIPNADVVCTLLGLPAPAKPREAGAELGHLATRPDFWVLVATDREIDHAWLGNLCPVFTRLCQLFEVDLAGIRAERESAYKAAQKAAKEAVKPKAEQNAKAKKAKPLAGDVRRAKAQGA